MQEALCSIIHNSSDVKILQCSLLPTLDIKNWLE